MPLSPLLLGALLGCCIYHASVLCPRQDSFKTGLAEKRACCTDKEGIEQRLESDKDGCSISPDLVQGPVQLWDDSDLQIVFRWVMFALKYRIRADKSAVLALPGAREGSKRLEKRGSSCAASLVLALMMMRLVLLMMEIPTPPTCT
jgi:hypothetical protein